MTKQISRKKTIFLVRLMVIVTSSYFIIFSPSVNKEWEIYGYIFIASYLLTNLLIVYIPEKYFYNDKIFYGFILFDSILLPAGIYVSGYTGSDLYLMFFFIISLTTMSASFGYLMVNTLFFSVIYCWILYEKGILSGSMAGNYLIQIPFIIIIAAFYGYLVTTRLRDKDARINQMSQRYEQVVQATDVLMCIVDHDGKLIFANKKFAEFYGYKDEKNLYDLTIAQIYDEDEGESEKSSGYIQSVYKNNTMVRYQLYDKKNNIWFVNTLGPIRDSSTQDVVAVCIISKDITDLIEKEKKLNNTVELLIKTRDQLIQQDKMAALGRMASGIAHEIRNPMEIIYMGADYLENNIPNDNPVIHESINKIFHAVSRTDSIINNVLSFSRQSPCEIKQIRICSMLDNLLKLVRPFMKHGISVQCQYDDDELEVAGDNMLEQVFLNLINNAVDAMKESKEKILTIRVYKKLITEIGYKTGKRYTDFFRIGDDKVVVEVSDTGKGIPKDVMSKIFEPFFTTKAVNEGTGLGLSIVHSILERMQGTIDVQSIENQGSTFFVNLQPQIKIADIRGEKNGREIQSAVH